MRQFVGNATYFLLLIFVISIVMIGFNSFHKNANQLTVDKANQPTDISAERLQVGTDLDTQKLQPISEAYYQQSGVRIDWVPIVSTEPHATAENHPIADLEADSVGSPVVDSTVQEADYNRQQAGIDQQIYLSATLQTLDPNKLNPLTLAQGLDMLLMHSAYSLDIASQNHQLQPLSSEWLMTKIPKPYQDPDGKWFGISQYGRTLVYNKNHVNQAELVNYTVVAANKWFGKLCMTALERPENQAIAKLLQTYRGDKKTAEILAGWQRNMGKPALDDGHVLAQIDQGDCDVGIVDSDTFWHYAKTNPDTLVRLTWANQINQGVSTNTITAAAVKEGDDVGEALGFIEWLMSDQGQALLAFNTSTFPVTQLSETDINQQAIRPMWANYEADSTPLATIMDNKGILKPALPEASSDTLPNTASGITTNRLATAR